MSDNQSDNSDEWMPSGLHHMPDLKLAMSTEHGPWVQSQFHEDETYCQRCMLRSAFASHRKCEPHLVAAPAQPAPQAQEPNAWRDTVDDMLTVCHMVASDDPRESIDRLINWHVSVALDPDVSSDAAALVARGAAQELEALRAERDAAVADAQRYRWLRARMPGSAYRIAGVIYSEGGSGVDAAIDAARAQEKKP